MVLIEIATRHADGAVYERCTWQHIRSVLLRDVISRQMRWTTLYPGNRAVQMRRATCKGSVSLVTQGRLRKKTDAGDRGGAIPAVLPLLVGWWARVLIRELEMGGNG